MLDAGRDAGVKWGSDWRGEEGHAEDFALGLTLGSAVGWCCLLGMSDSLELCLTGEARELWVIAAG